MTGDDRKAKKIRPYEKPKLRIIELAAEEVLGIGCKTAYSGSAVGGGLRAWFVVVQAWGLNQSFALRMKSPHTRFSIHTEIAGIHFSVSCRNATIVQDSDPAYRSFLRTERAPSTLHVDIRLELDSMPDTGRLTKLFDSGESWFICEDHEQYFLSLSSPESRERPVWTARFDRNMREIIVYCSKRLTRGEESRRTVSNPFRYPLDQLLLMYVLAQQRGGILHAAGMVVNKKGYLFPGRSGAGKSTLLRLCSRRNNFDLLSDDRMAVRKIDEGYMAFGTPWPGEAGIAVNEGVPLAGIFFIRHGSENGIKEIDRKGTLERLFPVTSIPWYDGKITGKILDFCEDLISSIPAFELSFRPEVEVVNVLEKFVSR